MAFLESLRMQNLFPTQENPAPSGTPFGMPDFSGGQPFNLHRLNSMMVAIQDKDRADKAHEIDMFNRHKKGRLDELAMQLAGRKAEQDKPMDVVFKPSISEYQRGMLGLKQQDLEQRGTIAEQKGKVSQQRADTYDFKARHPGMKFDTSGPTVLAMNPVTGEAIDTGQPTGSMSEREKIALNQENTMLQLGERGKQTAAQIAQRGAIESGLVGQRGVETRKTQSEKPTDEPKAELPTQTKVREFNAARQLLNSNPELGRFIKMGGGANEFTITPPSSGGFFGGVGPTQEQFDQIRAAIYGDQVSPESKVMTKTQTNRTTGAKRTLYSNDGGKTWTPNQPK